MSRKPGGEVDAAERPPESYAGELLEAANLPDGHCDLVVENPHILSLAVLKRITFAFSIKAGADISNMFSNGNIAVIAVSQ